MQLYSQWRLVSAVGSELHRCATQLPLVLRGAGQTPLNGRQAPRGRSVHQRASSRSCPGPMPEGRPLTGQQRTPNAASVGSDPLNISMTHRNRCRLGWTPSGAVSPSGTMDHGERL